MTDIKLFHRALGKRTNLGRDDFNAAAAAKVLAFHRTLPGYSPTPLAHLPAFAKQCGVADIFVKDESKRFGLNAFKGLGGSWCLANLIAKKLGTQAIDFHELCSPESLKRLGKTTFITATDGNHGMGIAWTAQQLQQNCVVYLPKGSTRERVERIRRVGAKAEVTDMNYDQTVEFAQKLAAENGWEFVQDTDRPGYTQIPALIMQGYLTMACEAVAELKAKDVKPTHVFLQAGVGSMAGSIAAYLSSVYEEDPPVFVIVEADAADCIHQTMECGDGTVHIAQGDLATMMAGLACGIPSMTGLKILEGVAENFATVTDRAAARGMRILGNPLEGDDRVVSGESGAAGFSAFVELAFGDKHQDLRKAAGLDENSVVLCFSTEGDTDKANYRKVVWEGVPPSA